MRVLLDNCVPARFGNLLFGHDIKHVGQAGLGGLLDGELLRAIANEADVFITVDKSLRFQQNMSQIKFSIVVLRAKSNRLRDLAPLAPIVLEALLTLGAGEVVELRAGPL